MAFDFVEGDVDPSNIYAYHGTSIGGIIGSVKDNDVCGVGIAYDVNLGGKIFFKTLLNKHSCIYCIIQVLPYWVLELI